MKQGSPLSLPPYRISTDGVSPLLASYTWTGKLVSPEDPTMPIMYNKYMNLVISGLYPVWDRSDFAPRFKQYGTPSGSVRAVRCPNSIISAFPYTGADFSYTSLASPFGGHLYGPSFRDVADSISDKLASINASISTIELYYAKQFQFLSGLFPRLGISSGPYDSPLGFGVDAKVYAYNYDFSQISGGNCLALVTDTGASYFGLGPFSPNGNVLSYSTPGLAYNYAKIGAAPSYPVTMFSNDVLKDHDIALFKDAYARFNRFKMIVYLRQYSGSVYENDGGPDFLTDPSRQAAMASSVSQENAATTTMLAPLASYGVVVKGPYEITDPLTSVIKQDILDFFSL